MFIFLHTVNCNDCDGKSTVDGNGCRPKEGGGGDNVLIKYCDDKVDGAAAIGGCTACTNCSGGFDGCNGIEIRLDENNGWGCKNKFGCVNNTNFDCFGFSFKHLISILIFLSLSLSLLMQSMQSSCDKHGLKNPEFNGGITNGGCDMQHSRLFLFNKTFFNEIECVVDWFKFEVSECDCKFLNLFFTI